MRRRTLLAGGIGSVAVQWAGNNNDQKPSNEAFTSLITVNRYRGE